MSNKNLKSLVEYVNESQEQSKIQAIIEILKQNEIKYGTDFKLNKSKTGFIVTMPKTAEDIADALAGTPYQITIDKTNIVVEDLGIVNEARDFKSFTEQIKVLNKNQLSDLYTTVGKEFKKLSELSKLESEIARTWIEKEYPGFNYINESVNKDLFVIGNKFIFDEDGDAVTAEIINVSGNTVTYETFFHGNKETNSFNIGDKFYKAIESIENVNESLLHESPRLKVIGVLKESSKFANVIADQVAIKTLVREVENSCYDCEEMPETISKPLDSACKTINEHLTEEFANESLSNIEPFKSALETIKNILVTPTFTNEDFFDKNMITYTARLVKNYISGKKMKFDQKSFETACKDMLIDKANLNDKEMNDLKDLVLEALDTSSLIRINSTIKTSNKDYTFIYQVGKSAKLTANEINKKLNDLKIKSFILKEFGDVIGIPTKDLQTALPIIVSDHTNMVQFDYDDSTKLIDGYYVNESKDKEYIKDVKSYKFFVVDIAEKRAVSGWEFESDAKDALSDYDGDKNFKVIKEKDLDKYGIENPKEKWINESELSIEKEKIKTKYEKIIESKNQKIEQLSSKITDDMSTPDKAEIRADIAKIKATIADDKANLANEIEQLNNQFVNAEFTMTEDNHQSYADLIIIDSNGMMLILKRPSDDFAPDTWCLPGGKAKILESGESAALREAIEEAGIDALNSLTVDDINFKGQYTNENGSTSGYYSCLIDVSNPKANLSDEHVEYKWIDISDIDKYDLMFDLGERLTEIFRNSGLMPNV